MILIHFISNKFREISCKHLENKIQYTSLHSETCLGHAWPPIAIDGIRWLFMALAWSHSSIASWPPMELSGAMGGHAWHSLVFTVW